MRREASTKRGMRKKGYIMSEVTKPWLLLFPEFVTGSEGENDADKGDAGDDKSGGSGDADDASKGSQNDSSNQPDPKDDDTAGLKSALEKERANAKKLAKELAKRQADDDAKALADKSEVEQANAKLEAANGRAAKLAAGLLNRDLNAAITKAAADLKFIDTADAIDGVDRSKLVFEQDDDDPSDITIDEKSIKLAVKALADKKPHFITKGTDDGGATGSQFGGSNNKDRTDKDATLKDLYPALQ